MSMKSVSKMIWAIIVLFLFVVLYSSSSQASPNATIWYVSQSGNGTACTQATPCSLSTAIQNSASGDIVIIKGGGDIYYGNTLLSIDHHLHFYGSWTGNSSGAPLYDPVGSRTVITGWDQYQVAHIDYVPSSPNNQVEMRNLTLSHGKATSSSSDGGNGGCIQLESGHLYLENVVIENCEAERRGGGIYVAYSTSPNTIQVRNTTFHNNRARSTTSDAYGGAIFTYNASGWVRQSTFTYNRADYGGAIYQNHGLVDIIGNWFDYNLGETAVTLVGTNDLKFDNFENNIVLHSSGTALRVFNYDIVRVYHNTFYGNDTTLLAVSGTEVVDVVFYNNIAAFNGGEDYPLFEIIDDADLSLNTNIFWKNDDESFVGANAILENPAYDANYHLTPDSPAINAGMIHPVIIVETDFDEQLRDSKPDIGADEFISDMVYLPILLK